MIELPTTIASVFNTITNHSGHPCGFQERIGLAKSEMNTRHDVQASMMNKITITLII